MTLRDAGRLRDQSGVPDAPRILLLGTIDLVQSTGSIGSPYQRALLALLALRVGSVVPTEEAIDCLWPERVPAAPQASVHTYVSRIRRLLAPRGIQVLTRAAGYRLAVASEDVDSVAFERSVERARAEQYRGEYVAAVARLDQAARLWRGPALADLREWRFASAAAVQLDNARVEAEALRHRLALTVGRAEGVVGALQRLLKIYPLHEQLAGLLMWALYEEGRQSEALLVYQRTADRLRRESGIDPGPWLTEAQRLVLTHGPAQQWFAAGR
jgi:DNA-binding SARP family transcriptional activator